MYCTYNCVTRYFQEISGLKEFKLSFLDNRTVTQMAEMVNRYMGRFRVVRYALLSWQQYIYYSCKTCGVYLFPSGVKSSCHFLHSSGHLVQVCGDSS